MEPDIITMAKAAGNGHPLGFVITSKQIATEFGAEGSFFSSAGGGPVSCAIGSAVLEVLERDGLQENARVVGAYLNAELKALAKKHPHIIGCIHGHGLYQGVELVKSLAVGRKHGDEAENEGERGAEVVRAAVPQPATAEAYAICERLLELGVICHNTGDYSNVLKVCRS